MENNETKQKILMRITDPIDEGREQLSELTESHQSLITTLSLEWQDQKLYWKKLIPEWDVKTLSYAMQCGHQLYYWTLVVL